MELREIPGHPQYYAGDDGQIYSSHGPGANKLPKGKKKAYRLKRKAVQFNNNGYVQVGIVVGPRGRRTKKKKYVHRLVALAWLGKPPNINDLVRHLNGRRFDNRPSNLRYGDPVQNYVDMKRHRDKPSAMSPKRAKLIRNDLMLGFTVSACASRYGATYASVYALAQGLTWRKPEYGLTKAFREWQRNNLGRPGHSG